MSQERSNSSSNGRPKAIIARAVSLGSFSGIPRNAAISATVILAWEGIGIEGIEVCGEVILILSTTASESGRSLGAGSLKSLNMSDERRLRVPDGPAGEVARNCGKLGRVVSRRLADAEVVAGEGGRAVELVGVSGIVRLCFCEVVVSAGRLNLNSQ